MDEGNFVWVFEVVGNRGVCGCRCVGVWCVCMLTWDCILGDLWSNFVHVITLSSSSGIGVN